MRSQKRVLPPLPKLDSSAGVVTSINTESTVAPSQHQEQNIEVEPRRDISPPEEREEENRHSFPSSGSPDSSSSSSRFLPPPSCWVVQSDSNRSSRTCSTSGSMGLSSNHRTGSIAAPAGATLFVAAGGVREGTTNSPGGTAATASSSFFTALRRLGYVIIVSSLLELAFGLLPLEEDEYTELPPRFQHHRRGGTGGSGSTGGSGGSSGGDGTHPESPINGDGPIPLSSLPYTQKRRHQLRTEIKRLFLHGYDSYMKYAFPMDELKPLSCVGHDDFGGYSLTLVDTLDSLVLFGEDEEFMRQAKYLADALKFKGRRNKRVSVFETTIRVLGGLISSHYIAERLSHKYANRTHMLNGKEIDPPDLFHYNGELLRPAVELADRLIGAFDTPTGIAFNEIDLDLGVDRGAGHTTCPAGAGSLVLEFSALAALTGNCTYHTLAHRSLMGVWKHRSRHHLVGTMIDIMNGRWGNGEATIGASVDSFYEYLLKGYIAFGDAPGDNIDYYDTWITAYRAVQKYMLYDGWYVSSSVDVRGALEVEHRFNSLQMFWPGLQVLGGDVLNAIDSYERMHCVTRHHGLPPEYCHIDQFVRGIPEARRTGPGYPLRPEFIESTYFLHRATGDDIFLSVGEEFLRQLKKTERPCGFSAVLDVYQWTMEDKMDSFVLAETFKYLYLLFSKDDEYDGTVSLFDKKGSWIVNTEAHPVPLTEAMQSLPKVCATSLKTERMATSDPRLIDESFSYHRESEYERLGIDVGRRPFQYDERRMCRNFNFMTEIAPLLNNLRNFEHRCSKPPDHGKAPLGHKDDMSSFFKHVPHHHPEGSEHYLQQQQQRQAQQQQQQQQQNRQQSSSVQYEIKVPDDPVEGSAAPQFVLATHNSHPGIHIDRYRGIVALSNVAAPRQSLYLAGNNIALRLTDDQFVPEKFSFVKHAQTARADFGPPLCLENTDGGHTANKVDPQVAEVFKTPLPLLVVKHSLCPSKSNPPLFSPDDIPRHPLTGQPRKFAILVKRGDCMFKEKVLAAQELGASLVIIWNHEHTGATIMADVTLPLVDGVAARVTIPSLMITKSDADRILDFVELRKTVLEVGDKEEPSCTNPADHSCGGGGVAGGAIEGVAAPKQKKRNHTPAPGGIWLQVESLCLKDAVEQFKTWGVVLEEDESNPERHNRVLLYAERRTPIVDVFRFKERFERYEASVRSAIKAHVEATEGTHSLFRISADEGLLSNREPTAFLAWGNTLCGGCRLSVLINDINDPPPALPQPSTQHPSLAGKLHQGAGTLLVFTNRQGNRLTLSLEHFPTSSNLLSQIPNLQTYHRPQFTQRMLTKGDPIHFCSRRSPRPSAGGHAGNRKEGEQGRTGSDSSISGGSRSGQQQANTQQPLSTLEWGVVEVRTFYLKPVVEAMDTFFDSEQQANAKNKMKNFSELFVQLIDAQHHWAQDRGLEDAGIVARYFAQDRQKKIGQYIEILVFRSEADRSTYRNAAYEDIQFHDGHLLQDKRSLYEVLSSATVDIFDTPVSVELV